MPRAITITAALTSTLIGTPVSGSWPTSNAAGVVPALSDGLAEDGFVLADALPDVLALAEVLALALADVLAEVLVLADADALVLALAAGEELDGNGSGHARWQYPPWPRPGWWLSSSPARTGEARPAATNNPTSSTPARRTNFMKHPL